MEFYAIARLDIWTILKCFNSQRDGILHRVKNGDDDFRTRFNSQRDGILLYRQTPKRVEGYSFNSQRDGILRGILGVLGAAVMFQFPTGWNSTLQTAAEVAQIWGFNSQRDGILLHLFLLVWFGIVRFNSQRDGILPAVNHIDEGPYVTFQFPTGWNSTPSQALRNSSTKVSIPNGMEFY